MITRPIGRSEHPRSSTPTSASVGAFVSAEIERLQAWQAHEDRQAERFAAYLTTLLRLYDDQLKAEGKVSARHKGYRLPHDTLTARQAH
jgi:hypothetical protein